MEGPQWSRDHPARAGGLGFLITDRELLGMLLWSHQEGRGSFPLLFPNCLNSSGFHMLPRPGWTSQLWNCPSVPEDKCHQGTAHCNSSQRPGRDSASPGKLMVLPETLPQPRQTRMAQCPIPQLPGMAFPSRAQFLGNFSFQLLAKGRTWTLMDSGHMAKHWCCSGGSQICTEPPGAATLGPDSTKLLSCCKVSLNWFLHPALLANFLLCHQRPDLIWQECALV